MIWPGVIRRSCSHPGRRRATTPAEAFQSRPVVLEGTTAAELSCKVSEERPTISLAATGAERPTIPDRLLSDSPAQTQATQPKDADQQRDGIAHGGPEAPLAGRLGGSLPRAGRPVDHSAGLAAAAATLSGPVPAL